MYQLESGPSLYYFTSTNLHIKSVREMYRDTQKYTGAPRMIIICELEKVIHYVNNPTNISVIKYLVYNVTTGIFRKFT